MAADPTLPDDPNQQEYNRDFIAGKFTYRPPALAGLPEGNAPIDISGGNTKGPQTFTNPDLTPEQEEGFKTPSTAFISAPYAGGVDEANEKEHLKALAATDQYHAVASRHHHLLAHSGRLADSADYLQELGGIDPTAEGAIDKHMALMAKYPGATGPAVTAANENHDQIVNQRYANTGEGYNELYGKGGLIESGHLAKEQIIHEPDGTIDWAKTIRLGREQGGKVAMQKEENAPEKRLDAAYKNLEILSRDAVRPDKDSDPVDYKAWRDRVQFLHGEIDNAQAELKTARAKTAPAAPAGPSKEFLATQNRFKTPGQVESLPATKAAAPMKTAEITGSDKYFSR